MADLGSLIVKVTTDLTSLNKGLKDAEKTVNDTAGKITTLTNNIGKALTIAGVAITGTFALMTKSVLDYNEEIYRLSEQTGISVETLSRLKYVADQNESSIEAVAAGLRFLSRNMYEAANGGDAAQKKFASLGISATDSAGKLKSAETVMFEIADRFKNMTDATEKSALAMQVFGRGGAAIIPVLNLGADGIRRAADEADRLGITLTTTNAKALDAFGDNLRNIREAMMGLWITIVNNMVPVLTELAKKVTDAIVKFRQFAEAHPILTKNITAAVLAFGVFALVVGPLILLLTSFASNIAMISIAVTTLGISISTVLLVALNGVGLALVSIAGIGIAAFVGWNIGRLIGEVTGLDNALSGPDGLFTRMFTWLDKVLPKWERFASFMWGAGNLPAYDVINAEAAARERTAVAGVTGPEFMSEEEMAGESSDYIISTKQKELSDLAAQQADYYNQQVALRQMDLDDVIRSLGEKMAIENLSAVERTAIEQNYYDFLFQKRVEDANNAYQSIRTITSTISSNLASAIVGAQSFSDAWKNIWQSLGTYIIEMVLNKIIAKLLEVLAINAMIKAAFAIIGLETGGMITESGNKAPIPQAKEGLFLEGGGPTPVLIHPPEVIMPLDKFKEMAGMGGGGMTVSFNNYGPIASEVDIEDLITRLGQRVKDAVRGS